MDRSSLFERPRFNAASRLRQDLPDHSEGLLAPIRKFYNRPMQLDAVEDQILPGDILLFRGRLLHSRVISRWTRSVYSHVGIAHRPCSAGCTSLDVLEAREGSGVVTLPLRTYLEQGVEVDWYRIGDPSINRQAVVRWAWHRRGHRYASYRQILRSFVTLPIAEFFGLDTQIDRGRWFCSWFAAEALAAGGWNPAGDDATPAHLTSPGAVSLFPCLHRQGPLTL